MSGPPPHDIPAPTLGLATELAHELGAAADVKVTRLPDGVLVDITPTESGACGLGWADFSEQIILGVGQGGARWELSMHPENLAFLANAVRSVIGGRVSEVHAPARSRVTLTMPDGSTETTTTYDGCLPLPFWRRSSRTIQYVPYR